MKTAVIKRSILINGKKTSVSLENEFWDALHEIAKYKNTTAAKLAGEIARQRNTVNLSSAIRIFVYNHFRSIQGKQKADHGYNPTRRHLDSATLLTRAEECRALAAGLKDEEFAHRNAPDCRRLRANGRGCSTTRARSRARLTF